MPIGHEIITSLMKKSHVIFLLKALPRIFKKKGYKTLLLLPFID